jgi:hypothetical protein
LASVGLVGRASEPVARFALAARDPAGHVVDASASGGSGGSGGSSGNAGEDGGVSLELLGGLGGSACLVDRPCSLDVPGPSSSSSSSSAAVVAARATYYFASSSATFTLEGLTTGLEERASNLGAMDVVAVYLDFLTAGPHAFDLRVHTPFSLEGGEGGWRCSWLDIFLFVDGRKKERKKKEVASTLGCSHLRVFSSVCSNIYI